AWATVLGSLGSTCAAVAVAAQAASWPVIISVGLSIAVVVVARAPRPAAFSWIGWAECGVFVVLFADRAGLGGRWVDAVLIGWGAMVFLGCLVRDRLAHGPVPSGAFIRERVLLAPASLGVVAMVVGSASALSQGTEEEIGWMALGLALVALASGLLLSLGVLGGLAEALAAAAFVLLARWEPLQHPWSIVPLVAVGLLVSWVTRSPGLEPASLRWDIPSFVVAHGIALVALVAAVVNDSVPPTFLAVGALSVLVSVVVHRWPWGAAGAVMVLVAAAEAGPGWLALALLAEGIALTVVGLQRSATARWILLTVGALAIVGAWFELIAWQSWSTPTVLYSTAPGAAGLSLAAALWVRYRAQTMREFALVWFGTGATVALAVSVLIVDADVGRRPGGLIVAGTFVVLAVASGVAARAVGGALRWTAAGLLAAAWAPAAWAIEPTATTAVMLMSLVALAALGAVLVVSAKLPTSPWIGPGCLWAVVTQLGGAAVALGELPSTDLVIVVLLASAAEFVALGVALRRPELFVLSPIFACAAWLLYASDALAGEANWFTVPVGVTLLVMVGLVRWIRSSRGGPVVGGDVVILEFVGMAFIVASPLAQTLAGHLWYAVLAVGLGVALSGWGVLTRVQRRAGFGAAAVVVAVLLLIGVPLSDLGAWSGPALWVTVIVIGLAAVVVATTIEQGRDRLTQMKHQLDDMTEGWERIGERASDHTER
ncbi:MAG: hypothetical protein ACERLM_13790, partial [Acidimicrobiales bacterium]